MSITQAKINILEIPDEQNATPLWYSINDYGVCTVQDAKALVKSHTALLDAAKKLISDEGFSIRDVAWTALLNAALEAEEIPERI
jgi:hypothetical protein